MKYGDPKFRNWIISQLRRTSFRWRPRGVAKKAAMVEVDEGFYKNGNPKVIKYYKCASCEQLYRDKDVQLDHIEPVIDPKIGFVSFDNFIERLFCDETGFQVLCSKCHDLKTEKEGKKRKRKRKVDKKPKTK